MTVPEHGLTLRSTYFGREKQNAIGLAIDRAVFAETWSRCGNIRQVVGRGTIHPQRQSPSPDDAASRPMTISSTETRMPSLRNVSMPSRGCNRRRSTGCGRKVLFTKLVQSFRGTWNRRFADIEYFECIEDKGIYLGRDV